MESDTRIPISSAADIVTARQKGRAQAMDMGFDGSDLTLIATAISEVARNIVDHAKRGEILIEPFQQNGKHGMLIVARDEGPGIPNVAQAMQYGYSTRKGLGVGLPGAKWLMDEFEVDSKVGKGTTITMKKWL
ncbi:MAG TPA: anti-sigma regulatory factor [Verrucomicrobiae bacterium]|nr:anti-sigma regulatory factor [Verrucomicrobiae bacterium]